jgi:hypothetical protein
MARISKATKQAQIAAAKARRMENYLRYMPILKAGKCQECGTKLYRNLSLSGWWQCGHVGAVGFQKEAGPHCNYQFFFDPSPREHDELLLIFSGAIPAPTAEIREIVVNFLQAVTA